MKKLNASDTTSNIGLSQFDENDTPKWLDDYNDDMEKIDAAVATKLNILDLFNKVYPIGTIYESTNATSPALLFGGTWAEYGQGRVLVGIDSSQTDFNSIKTGGAKSHTLGENEIPNHEHIDPKYMLTGRTIKANGGTGADLISITSNGAAGGGYSILSGEMTSRHLQTSAHNNLQPYQVVYMWRRTA